jgi:hypothetical protein
MIKGMRLGIDVDRSLHGDIESTDFIKAEGMVNMVVGKQNRVTPINTRSQHLLAQIRRGINQDGAGVVLIVNEPDGGRSPQAFIPRIITTADLALAPDGGDARRRA